FLLVWQPSQQHATYMAASARVNKLRFNLLSSMAAFKGASKLRCSLHSILQLIWQSPQEPARFIVAFTLAYNLYGSLCNSQ
ncbi:hypothetical protein Tco_0106453, partial [Tanacetum coccineum]